MIFFFIYVQFLLQLLKYLEFIALQMQDKCFWCCTQDFLGTSNSLILGRGSRITFFCIVWVLFGLEIIVVEPFGIFWNPLVGLGLEQLESFWNILEFFKNPLQFFELLSYILRSSWSNLGALGLESISSLVFFCY